MRQPYIWRWGWEGEMDLESLIQIMYLTLGMLENSASKSMTWLTFTEHSKQKEVHFPLIEVCQPGTYSACWLLFTLHRDSPQNSKASQTCPFLHSRINKPCDCHHFLYKALGAMIKNIISTQTWNYAGVVSSLFSTITPAPSFFLKVLKQRKEMKRNSNNGKKNSIK